MNNAELTWVFVALAFALTLLGRYIVRRFRVRFRPLAAYALLPELAADAVESSNRIHLSMGSSALGSASTITALVSAEVFYRLSERLAISRQSPVITLSDPMTLPLAQDTLRRAYEFRQNMAHYRTSAATWYPYGSRSLSFAAGIASLAADYDVDSSVVLGRFGTELAFVGEGAFRRDQSLIAHSDLVEGQAVAYALADRALVGEELYVGPAYMDGNALERGSVIALDVLRWLVIVGILLVALQSI
ncbi:MAG: hypothetical protein JXQ72_02055, partial [Anaerolineae bacterium]|nr:hypothetical protein [Anaerolineae bacterium]